MTNLTFSQSDLAKAKKQGYRTFIRVEGGLGAFGLFDQLIQPSMTLRSSFDKYKAAELLKLHGAKSLELYSIMPNGKKELIRSYCPSDFNKETYSPEFRAIYDDQQGADLAGSALTVLLEKISGAA